MVKRCVVQFCSNTNQTGHTMHKFPKDANLKRQWVKFVQVKRADFVRPTEHSVICNVHFTPDCYEKSFMVEMGLKKQKQLIPGAVPTVQSPAANNYSDGRKRVIQNEDTVEQEVVGSADKRPKRSRALQKLEVNRVSTENFKPLILVKYRK